MVKWLKRRNCLVSVDPHELWITGYETILQSMLAEVDCFLPSRFEARLCYGLDAPEEAVRAFAEWGPEVVVIKLGAEGSLVYEAGQRRVTHIPIYPAQVRDTTGAGDAFCGGFLAGYLLTGNPITAAQYGTVSASYIIEGVGALATAQPSFEDVQRRLAIVSEGTEITP
jgi:ribokinase